MAVLSLCTAGTETAARYHVCVLPFFSGDEGEEGEAEGEK